MPARGSGSERLSGDDTSATERVGLCAHCRHAGLQTSAKGSCFWRCRRADRDERFLRYPPLPVCRCGGFEPGPPEPKIASDGPAGRKAR